MPDPDFGRGEEDRIRASLPPVHAFRAHNAPLGMTFIRGTKLPADYRGAALVALHGSWNRTEKDGYKVVSLHWPEGGGAIEERDFLWGLELNDDVIGRPVDVVEGPDGAFYVTDDYARTIYRVAYTGAGTSTAFASPPLEALRERGDPLASLDATEHAALASHGAALFELHECARCHDVGGAAPGVVPVPLSNLSKRYDLAELGAFLVAPTPPMPAFELSAEERRALAVHLLERHGGGSRD